MRGIVLIMLLCFAAAHADDSPAPAEATAVREVIAAQLDAFNRDDGNAAFGFASPGIQAKFQTAETFMAMVRTGYAPVYRSVAAEFGTLREVGGRLVQEVVVTGQDGTVALAVYTLARQADGSLRIDGCTLHRLPDVGV